MKCPTCNNVNLLLTERQGIEIDYCPECRGVWLDRGELDKIIERSASISGTPPSPVPLYAYDSHHQREHDEHYGEHGRRKRWFSEFFD